ncbi:MAG TPA: archaemetzincin [Candidatus Hydrogenedentes bacterium]|nr:archaemetzincin [Candidatus Hydrogenedentota bacterium]
MQGMRNVSLLIVCPIVILCGGTKIFTPPTAKERTDAIGPLMYLPPTLRAAFEDSTDFDPIPAPGSNDWLAVHNEPGQTFDQFVQSNPNRPDSTRTTIYLLPLGEFPKEQSALIDQLKTYASAYFAMKVLVLPMVNLNDFHLTTRINSTSHTRQILSTDVLDRLKSRLPSNAFCLLAITMEDLYPEPSWNFVFGEASLQERVGVYSFLRYDPAFYGAERGPDYLNCILRRSAQVFVHETGHMFGLEHCIHFRCVMNGSNHLAESDSQPLHLCPVCLRKLQHSIGFDVLARERELRRFYQTVGFNEEARWTAKRIDKLVNAAKREDGQQ